MYLPFGGIFLPDFQIRLYIHILDPVQSHNIHLPHRLIIFRRISSPHDQPALWNGMAPEGFVLQ